MAAEQKKKRPPRSSEPTELGKLIRERRDAIGMTQEQLADHLGIERPTLVHIETGRTAKMAPDLVNKLPQFIPVKVRELLSAMGYAIDQDSDDIDRWLQEDAELTEALVRLLSRRRHRPNTTNGDASATEA